MELAVTYKCNFECVYCSAVDFEQDKRELSFEEICKLFDDAYKMGLCVVSITGGEPMIREDLGAIIAYAKKKGISCTMFTNARLLTERKTIEYKKAGLLRLMVTYYGGDEDSFAKFTKQKNAFEQVQENVVRAKRMGLHVSLQIVPTEDDLVDGGLEEKVGFARKHGLSVNFNFPARCGGWKNNKRVPLSQDKFGKVYKLFSETWVTNDTLNSISGKRRCPAVKSVVYITAQGDVIPCAYVPLSWGNIRERALHDIIKDMQKSPTYGKAYDHCVAGENPEWVNRYIDPIYESTNFDKLPMNVKSHPRKEELWGQGS
jgi:MoaA/NifB/PqqE/SkfB family radical SAM enzyme